MFLPCNGNKDDANNNNDDNNNNKDDANNNNNNDANNNKDDTSNLQSGVVWSVHGVDGDLPTLAAVQAVQLKQEVCYIELVLFQTFINHSFNYQFHD